MMTHPEEIGASMITLYVTAHKALNFYARFHGASGTNLKNQPIKIHAHIQYISSELLKLPCGSRGAAISHRHLDNH
jgi:hypothetical protein